jgi:DNA helicase II / ATP-dependent DNA helicase PcrA
MSSTPLHKNQIIIASAGSRKTTFVIENALSQPASTKVLITTYTLENLDQKREYIVKKNGYIPKNITICSWYSFLLIECVRPYQHFITGDRTVKSIDFNSTPPNGISKGNLNFYLNTADNMYRDRASDFICAVCEKSKCLTIDRLKYIYDVIYIDEMQDLSGWDYNFVELLLKSPIHVVLVGDPRQSTYTTTNSMKNRGMIGENMLNWIMKLVKSGLSNYEEKVECYRSNQSICDFADKLYPSLVKTVSKETSVTDHDGIFLSLLAKLRNTSQLITLPC